MRGREGKEGEGGEVRTEGRHVETQCYNAEWLGYLSFKFEVECCVIGTRGGCGLS